MPQAANVIPLPVEKFTFEAVEFEGTKMPDQYTSNSVYVAMLQKILECSPKQLKKALSRLEGSDQCGDEPVEKLIADFEEVAKDYAALSELFETGAARLIAVKNKLI